MKIPVEYADSDESQTKLRLGVFSSGAWQILMLQLKKFIMHYNITSHNGGGGGNLRRTCLCKSEFSCLYDTFYCCCYSMQLKDINGIYMIHSPTKKVF